MQGIQVSGSGGEERARNTASISVVLRASAVVRIADCLKEAVHLLGIRRGYPNRRETDRASEWCPGTQESKRQVPSAFHVAMLAES